MLIIEMSFNFYPYVSMGSFLYNSLTDQSPILQENSQISELGIF